MTKLKNTLFVLSSLIVLNVANSTFAQTAPACPPLNGYNIYNVTNMFGPWAAFFDNGPVPMNSGFVETLATNQSDAKAIATYAMWISKPSGYAHKTYWPGSNVWFWVCSSRSGNYPLFPKTTEIFISSPDYSGYGMSTFAIKNQHSVQEQHDRFLQVQA